jgi:hypothetical protein
LLGRSSSDDFPDDLLTFDGVTGSFVPNERRSGQDRKPARKLAHLYRAAFERRADPAATIYQYTTLRGYRASAAAPTQPAGTPGTPLGGAAPAAPAPAARAPAPAAAAPTATDVVQSIQRGQAASQSLSRAGGTSPDTQLTPQALAAMSDAQFEALYNELLNKGDKEKLKDLFGH